MGKVKSVYLWLGRNFQDIAVALIVSFLIFIDLFIAFVPQVCDGINRDSISCYLTPLNVADVIGLILFNMGWLFFAYVLSPLQPEYETKTRHYVAVGSIISGLALIAIW